MAHQNTTPAVEAIINYTFRNKELLREALQAAGSPYGRPDGNKRLAMRGDAVYKVALLDTMIPTRASRGDIDGTISELMSQQNLAEVCARTGLAGFIDGNPSQVGEQPPKTRSATIQAIIGAVFLDSGKNIYSVFVVMAALGLEAPNTTGTG